MNIGTGDCGSEEVVEALRSMESLGQKQYKNFVKTVIEDRTRSFSHGELSPHRSLLWSTLTQLLFLMVNFQPITLFLMVNSHPIALFLMVNSHPIALFLMVNSHPIALSYGELSPHRSFSHGQLSPIALFLMVNSHPIALFLMVNSHPMFFLSSLFF